MSEWLYKGIPLSSKPPKDSSYGFVYLLTLNDGTLYVGKKSFWAIGKVKLRKDRVRRNNLELIRKRELMTYEELSNRTKTQCKANTKSKIVEYEQIVKESDWRKYTGSSKKFGSKDVVKKEVLFIAKSKRHLTYLEVRELFKHDVLEDMNYHNDCITKNWHKGNLI